VYGKAHSLLYAVTQERAVYFGIWGVMLCSVEGKMLRRACDKMALERLVIKKGVFKEVLDAARDNGSTVSSLLTRETLTRLFPGYFEGSNGCLTSSLWLVLFCLVEMAAPGFEPCKGG